MPKDKKKVIYAIAVVIAVIVVGYVLVKKPVSNLGSSLMAPKVSEKNITVLAKGFSFEPAEIIVKQGDKVKITIEDVDGEHSFVIDEFNIKTERMYPGEKTTVEFTADKTGTFKFYCGIGTHEPFGQRGTLIVQ